MTYDETIDTLCDLLEIMNLADTPARADWSMWSDAGQGYEIVRDALAWFAGADFLDYYAETGERDYARANRWHVIHTNAGERYAAIANAFRRNR